MNQLETCWSHVGVVLQHSVCWNQQVFPTLGGLNGNVETKNSWLRQMSCHNYLKNYCHCKQNWKSKTVFSFVLIHVCVPTGSRMKWGCLQVCVDSFSSMLSFLLHTASSHPGHLQWRPRGDTYAHLQVWRHQCSGKKTHTDTHTLTNILEKSLSWWLWRHPGCSCFTVFTLTCAVKPAQLHCFHVFWMSILTEPPKHRRVFLFPL